MNNHATDASSDDLSPVEILAEEFLDRQQQGKKPSIKEYCEQYPELADEIREVFEALMLVEDLKPDSKDVTGTFGGERQLDGRQLDRIGDYRIVREVGRGGMGIVYEAEQESLRRRVALKVLPRQNAADEKSLERFQREARAAARMHHTNIVPVFEVGEDDEWVFYAMQLIQGQGLDLVVDDLKRIRSEYSTQKSGSRRDADLNGNDPAAHSIAASLVVGRFERENLAQAAELAGGDSDSQPADSDSGALRAYAETVQHASGSTISAVLPGKSELSSAETNRRGYFQSVAHIGLQTARALSYAHARGIVHRDIKPSNLLLDAAGTVWVTDFGLAKTGDEGMTHTGDILGTIRYMSPERFRGQCDVRADVYSLGLTMYELLALKPAFNSPDRLKLIDLIARTDPESPRARDPGIPRDLETIVFKCIDKDPKRRYQSADELADDLQRFVDDEPIKARRISLVERFGRWSRRNKGLAAALSMIACLVLVGFVGSAIAAGYFRGINGNLNTTVNDLEQTKSRLTLSIDELSRTQNRLRNLNTDLETKKEAVERQAELTRRNLYFAHMQMAFAARETGNDARLREALDRWRTSDHANDLRSFEWYYLLSQGHNAHRILRGHTDDIRGMAWSPDGRYIASGSEDTTIKIWDARTGRLLKSIDDHTGGVPGISWSPDGRQFVSTSVDSTIRIWDAATGQELRRLSGHTGPAPSAVWCADGRRIVTAGIDGTARIWDAASGRQLAVLRHPGKRLYCAAWHPGGKRLAVGSFDDGLVRVWDIGNLKEPKIVETFDGHATRVTSLAWHRDGKRLASGGGNGKVCVWVPGNKQPVRELLGHEEIHWINVVAWHPKKENQLLSVCGDHTARLWDADTGKHLHTFRGHTHHANSGCWSPDGTRIATGSRDTTVRIWNVPTTETNTLPSRHAKDVRAVAWSPDGGLIATGGLGQTVRIWRTRDRKLIHTLVDSDQPQDFIRHLEFSPDGKQLAGGGRDGFVRVWDVDTGKRLHRFGRHGQAEQRSSYRGVLRVAWHPKRPILVSTGQDYRIRVWDTATGRNIKDFHPQLASVYAIRFSPDGKWAVTGHWHTTRVHIWDAATWETVGKIDDGNIMVRSIEFSPDGKRLAVAGGRGRDQDNPLSRDTGLLRIWDWETVRKRNDAKPELEIGEQRGMIWNVTWTADGKRLAMATSDRVVRLIDVSADGGGEVGRELLAVGRHNVYGTTAAFSPDGSKLALADGKTVAFYDAFDGYAREKSPQLLPTLAARVRAGTASIADYQLQAEIDAAEGNWDAAARAYQRLSELRGDGRWIVANAWVAGYFDGDLQKPFAPETAVWRDDFQPSQTMPGSGGNVGWRRIEFDPGAAIRFGDLLSRRKQKAAYALFQVYSPRRRRIGVLLGDDDAHKLWLNGKLLSEDATLSPPDPQQFAVPATLKRGRNLLLAKIVDVQGDAHAMYLRLTDDPVELAGAYERAGRLDAALRTWDVAVKDHPDDKALILKRAATRWKMGDRAEADEDFKRFVAGREADSAVLEARARAYLKLYRIRDGLAEYDRAVAADSESPGLRERCAQAYVRQDRHAGAVPHLLYLARRNPRDLIVHLRLARTQLEAGDETGYANTRSTILKRWDRIPSGFSALITAVTCLLRPAGGKELRAVVALAESAVAVPRDSFAYTPTRIVAALTEYREGQFSASSGHAGQAQRHFRASEAILKDAIPRLEGDQFRHIRAVAWFLHAMTAHRLNDAATAARRVETAEREFQSLPDDPSNPVSAICRALRSEALRQVYGPAYAALTRAERQIAAGDQKAAIDSIGAGVVIAPKSAGVLKRARELVNAHMLGHTPLSPTAEYRSVEWEVRFTPPRDGWDKPGARREAGWARMPGWFASRKHPGVRSTWDRRFKDIWLRREFVVKEVPQRPVVIRAFIDDIARISLNGVLIADRRSWTEAGYIQFLPKIPLSNVLKPGRNVLAVHCRDDGGKTGIDVGLYASGQRDAWTAIVTKAIEKSPESLQLVRERGRLHVRHERYLEAARDFIRFAPIEQRQDLHCMNTASLLALSGDRDAYRQYCEGLIAKYGKTQNAVDAEKLTKACLLLPGVIDPKKLPVAFVTENLDAKSAPDWWRMWGNGTAALAAYRAGDFDATLKRIARAEARIPADEGKPGHILRALLDPLRAMVHLRQRKDPRWKAIARQLLDKSAAIVEGPANRRPDGRLVGASLLTRDGVNHNAIIGEVLLRESERMFGSAGTRQPTEIGRD